MADERLAVVVKGFPRLSETFVARELEALEQRGLPFELHALRHPGKDAALTHYNVNAICRYLPEYLHDEPAAVLRAVAAASLLPGFGDALSLFQGHLRHDFSRARCRRFGQACVLATRLGSGIRHIHAHFAHSPASVVRYAAVMRQLSYSISAHAKDVWTDDEWDLREKLSAARFVAICNRAGHERLAGLMPRGHLHLIHHGIDPALVAQEAREQTRDGRDDRDPVRLVCVARAVEKKGIATLLRALALLPSDLHVRLDHYGDGELLGSLIEQSRSLGLAGRVLLHGATPHEHVVAALDESDLFVLPASVAQSGDRDGIPNALLEAKARGICILAGDAGGTGEAVRDNVTGQLVPPDVPDVLARRLENLCRSPSLRQSLAATGLQQDQDLFDAAVGHDALARLFREQIGAA
jgi:glycosyltransferase involved in cell wall biosynthesis